MKIRVLHVIDHLGYGGAPVVVKNITEKLDAERIETIVCALRTNPEAMPIKTTLISLTHHKYNPFAFITIAKLCKQHKIDIIHAHLQKSIISCLLAGFLCDAKIIIHEHGPIFRRGTGCIYRLLLKLLAKKASAAIANSQATIEALKQTAGFTEKSAYVVTNFVDFARFDHTIYDRQKTRDSFGITPDKKVVGFLGRLDNCKGADLLINAAAILCKKDPLYHFIIVGHGAQRNQLEQLVLQLGLKENVTFTGLCKNPPEVISAFDIAVVPSRREAFGIAAVEFMRMKIPVVASPVGGLVEVVQHNKTGILLDDLSADNIALAVSSLMQDNSSRETLAENAEIFSRKFDGAEQLKQITDIYKELSQ
ncbi:MAG: glycosyltransferase family 4 protein [Planctomycetes bacterium]|nr:glycosyltransferase family 4 protein [Planctomycetota bacterium]MBL7143183.1 glycosyltransferase family 4 protein [Phycisphaerae bacterium]